MALWASWFSNTSLWGWSDVVRDWGSWSWGVILPCLSLGSCLALDAAPRAEGKHVATWTWPSSQTPGQMFPPALAALCPLISVPVSSESSVPSTCRGWRCGRAVMLCHTGPLGARHRVLSGEERRPAWCSPARPLSRSAPWWVFNQHLKPGFTFRTASPRLWSRGVLSFPELGDHVVFNRMVFNGMASGSCGQPGGRCFYNILPSWAGCLRF